MHVIYAKCVLISHLGVPIELNRNKNKKNRCKHDENENEFEHNIKTQILINLRKIGCKSGIIRERRKEKEARKKERPQFIIQNTHSLAAPSKITRHGPFNILGGSQSMQISFCLTISLSLANYYPFFS